MTFRKQLLQPLAKAVLSMTGWKLISPSYETSQSVIVAYPHVSATDLYYTILIGLALNMRIKMVAKAELFVFGTGWLLKSLGLIPVTRGGKLGTTTALAEMFEESGKNFHLVIAPTGTRRETAEWHTGFLSVARKANVPILLAIINRKKKICGIFSSLPATRNPKADLEEIKARYNIQK
jgi:1-acyl-sn-glycerol-3-phosphate acyltransferase